METITFAGLLLHPLAVFALASIVALASVAAYYSIPDAPRISVWRLLGGYLGAILATVFIAGATSYVSPEEAQNVYRIPAENYWSALWHTFLTMFVILFYVTLAGIAVVGVPVILFLNSKQRATVPWILLAATIISIAGAIALEIFVRSKDPLRTIGTFVGGHWLLAIAFCLGARLPWRATAGPSSR
jgi:hypothetical protein